MDNTFTIVIKHSTSHSLHLDVEPSWTIADIKLRLSETFPGKPRVDKQRLLGSTGELGDNITIYEALLGVGS